MIGSVLSNRYKILSHIGEGGMANVYLAKDIKLGRRVAIKILHSHMAKNEDIRHRFRREAEAISQLDHPNIVKVFDYSESDNQIMIVAEYIDGINLSSFMSSRTKDGKVEPIVAACITREICRALSLAHSHGIIHRDIKPENVMLTKSGKIKLMDFGIAKDLEDVKLTQTGTFMGSPSYMSVEQIKGRSIDFRSDIYSLCVCFYEITVGKLPYRGSSQHDVVIKIMNGNFKSPADANDSIPNVISDIIVKGMQIKPTDRYQTIEQLGNILDQFLDQIGFDESHIELERLFRRSQSIQKKLKSMSTAKLNAIQFNFQSKIVVDSLAPTQVSIAKVSGDESAYLKDQSNVATEISHRLPTPNRSTGSKKTIAGTRYHRATRSKLKAGDSNKKTNASSNRNRRKTFPPNSKRTNPGNLKKTKSRPIVKKQYYSYETYYPESNKSKALNLFTVLFILFCVGLGFWMFQSKGPVISNLGPAIPPPSEEEITNPENPDIKISDPENKIEKIESITEHKQPPIKNTKKPAQETKEKTAEYNVHLNVFPRAYLKVNGKNMGLSDAKTILRLRPGSYRLELSKPGYNLVTKTITVSNRNLDVPLIRLKKLNTAKITFLCPKKFIGTNISIIDDSGRQIQKFKLVRSKTSISLPESSYVIESSFGATKREKLVMFSQSYNKLTYSIDFGKR